MSKEAPHQHHLFGSVHFKQDTFHLSICCFIPHRFLVGGAHLEKYDAMYFCAPITVQSLSVVWLFDRFQHSQPILIKPNSTLSVLRKQIRSVFDWKKLFFFHSQLVIFSYFAINVYIYKYRRNQVFRGFKLPEVIPSENCLWPMLWPYMNTVCLHTC